MDSLRDLCRYLESHPAVRDKATIRQAWGWAVPSAGSVRLGDDCAALPQEDGSHLLFASEAMLESFVRDDPWFAGYSAVMVNLSDVAAMGGYPVAITDTMASSSEDVTASIWDGLHTASAQYGVPIVGGHTTRTFGNHASLALSAAVLGKAGPHLLTSFDAQPGDLLVIVIDMDGAYRGDKPFWNCSTTATPRHLRSTLELLPLLAERRLCAAAKDISNGGVVGTLAMFCDCSGTGAHLDLELLPCPPGVPLDRWLVTFPSYGYLLAVSPGYLETIRDLFQADRITCEPCGRFTPAEEGMKLSLGCETLKLSLGQS